MSAVIIISSLHDTAAAVMSNIVSHYNFIQIIVVYVRGNKWRVVVPAVAPNVICLSARAGGGEK